MTLLREVLLSAGVSPRDLNEAVSEARMVVQRARLVGTVGARLLAKVGSARPEGPTRRVVLRTAVVLAHVAAGANGMLGGKR